MLKCKIEPSLHHSVGLIHIIVMVKISQGVTVLLELMLIFKKLLTSHFHMVNFIFIFLKQ